MSKTTWREFADPACAAAVVKAAEVAGWKRGRIMDFLEVGESTLRSWGGDVTQLRQKTAIAVMKLAKKVEPAKGASDA